MVSSSTSEYFYIGNGSILTQYPVSLDYKDESHIKVERLDAGTGTVTSTAGSVVFSSAQTDLEIGSHVRVAGVTYVIATRTSDTVFTFTTRPTFAASSFHLPDSSVLLTSGSTYTLTGVSGAASITTNPAIAATGLLRVYRFVPYQQLVALPETGPVPTAEIESALDLLEHQIQQIATELENAGVIVPQEGLSAVGSTSFANDAARAAAIPDRMYQLGVQVDTKTIYYASGTSAGNWTQTSFKARVLTDPTTDAPLYTGELTSFKGATIANKYAPAIYKGTGTSAGNWELEMPNREYGCFQSMVWDDNVPLDRGMKRMAGQSGLYRWVDKAMLAVARMGMGSLTVRFYTSDTLGGRNVINGATIAITAEESGSSTNPLDSLIDPGIGAAGTTQVMAPTDRIYAEISSAGEEFTPTTVAGSTTINDANLARICTGSVIDGPTDSTGVITGVASAISGAAAIVRSHAFATNDGPCRLNGRIFARLLTGTWAGQQRIIDSIVAADTALFCAGDRVIGDVVHPDCRIESIPSAGTSIVLTHPLLGGATAVTVISEDRPPVVQFTNISEASGQTVLDAHNTTFIEKGDLIWGTNVPALARVTAKSSTTITSSAALSNSITGYTVRPPQRAATIVAGTSTITCTTTDLRIGGKVIGTVVPPNTFINAIAVGSMTVNNVLSLNASGGSTDLIEVTREELEVHLTLTLGSTAAVLAYSVASTYVDCTYDVYCVVGPGIQPGTLATAASLVTVTLNKAAVQTTSGLYRLYRPSRWKGLSVSIAGRHYAGTT